MRKADKLSKDIRFLPQFLKDFSQEKPCSKINLPQEISVKNNAKLCAKVILKVIIDNIHIGHFSAKYYR